ncbi:MAG: DUF1501 domain-containing protein [Planctomycetaceae bacterium]|nr:DUF1501 domain-containing protein [Planctomycetaceae bacterium]
MVARKRTTRCLSPIDIRHSSSCGIPCLSRRDALVRLGSGFGGIALADLLRHSNAFAADAANANLNGGLHHRAKVKRVVQLFMNGGVSQMDTFDYKPELEKRHGEQVDLGVKAAATSLPGAVMQSPFPFKQYGECGRWVSDVLPHMAGIVDEVAFLMAMASKTNVHGPASYLQNTGFLLPGFPSMGAWISYGLGNLTDNLPTFVVLPDPRGLPYNNLENFGTGFLPRQHQGTVVRPTSPTPIHDIAPPAFAKEITTASEADGLKLLGSINARHAERHPGDSRLEARIASYELAAKMQLAAPEALDLSKESEATHTAYGLDEKETADFGRNCLTARRLLERGVRFVQVWSGAGGPKDNWDNHSDIHTELPTIARSVDRPTAALVHDLKSRGMLEDTLVVWTTEFGRMPFTQGATGRDHNGGTFVTWLAGAGIKPGVAYGQSDDFSLQAADGKTECYDLHATILHLLGVDHTRLTYRHDGIDRRLTDVHGHVVREILA